ncbi:hypothetical protein SALWKB12_1300 [Snodgrassella communis]|uniref:Uncharacterized protein n=1 Tax=Snodgrassella communis TaxID=2946699 RepID=A0A836MQ54_9NEIS|nr:hypothetical protein SALWKB12_1300 [Snodgrassella communis]KDN15048.1 hypothetical protein SALWKB29_1120 [Snodgrassella communis]
MKSGIYSRVKSFCIARAGKNVAVKSGIGCHSLVRALAD